MKTLGNLSAMDNNDPRKVPMSTLSSWGYEIWLQNYRKSKKIDKISHPTGRCECFTRISYFVQCEHELSMRPFDVSEWALRWHQRQTLEPSHKIVRVDHQPAITFVSQSLNGVDDDKVSTQNNVLQSQLVFSDHVDDTNVTGRKPKYSTQQGYGRLTKAFNTLATLGSKNEDTCNTMIGFASLLETFLLTGDTIEDNQVTEWLSKVRVMGCKRKFAHVSVNSDTPALPVSQRNDVGRPMMKRLKSFVEMKTNRRKKSCRFCLEPGHIITSCASARLHGRWINNKDRISELIVSIRKDRTSRPKAKLSADTKMFVPGGVAFLSMIEYTLDGIMCTCLASGGQPLHGWTEKVIHVDSVIDWVIKHGRGNLFSKLEVTPSDALPGSDNDDDDSDDHMPISSLGLNKVD